jgi:hypothetical protein
MADHEERRISQQQVWPVEKEVRRQVGIHRLAVKRPQILFAGGALAGGKEIYDD